MTRQLEAYHKARELIGLKEIKGPVDDAAIVGMFAEVGHGWVKDDETAWCAAFVGAMLQRAGLPSTKKLNARSYAEWGDEVPLGSAKAGDIVVFSRGAPNGWQGHVGFYVAHGNSTVTVLGGNQGNAVSEAPYKINRLLSVRRMAEASAATPPTPSNIFATLGKLIALLFGKAKP